MLFDPNRKNCFDIYRSGRPVNLQALLKYGNFSLPKVDHVRPSRTCRMLCLRFVFLPLLGCSVNLQALPKSYFQFAKADSLCPAQPVMPCLRFV